MLGTIQMCIAACQSLNALVARSSPQAFQESLWGEEIDGTDVGQFSQGHGISKTLPDGNSFSHSNEIKKSSDAAQGIPEAISCHRFHP
jgi:hypothetical protein